MACWRLCYSIQYSKNINCHIRWTRVSARIYQSLIWKAFVMIIPETFAVKGEIIGIGIWSTENLSHSDATYKVHVYYMLSSYQTGYILWHSRLKIYIPWGAAEGNIDHKPGMSHYMSDSWITDILRI
jgi:hypothetical protein